MAWIELHQSLPQNKKIMRLKRILNIKTPQAVGHMCMLWLWAVDNVPDGDLSEFTPEDIAEVCGWTKKANLFYDALVEVGFIDSDNFIHDWDEYAGKLLEQREIQREQARLRQQKRRKKLRANTDISEECNVGNTRGEVSKATDVSRTCNASVTRDVTQESRSCHGDVTRDVTQMSRVSHAPTVPNSTVPNSTVPTPYVSNNNINKYNNSTTATKALYNNYNNIYYKTKISSKFRDMVGIGSRGFSENEKKLLKLWFEERKYPFELVKLAYDVTIDCIQRYNINYINSILERWHSEGITTVEQAKEDAKTNKGKRQDFKNETFDGREFFYANLMRSQPQLVPKDIREKLEKQFSEPCIAVKG